MELLFREFEPEEAILPPPVAEPSALAPSVQDAPVYTQDQLDTMIAKARQDAWAEGLEAGIAQGQTAAEQSISAQVQTDVLGLKDSLAGLLQQDAEIKEEAIREWLGIGLEFIERVVPEFQLHYAQQGAELRAREALKIAQGQPSVVIKLSADTEAAIGNSLRQVAEELGNADALRLVVEPSLAAGQVQARWQHGALDYDLEGACAEMLAALRAAAETANHHQKKG